MAESGRPEPIRVMLPTVEVPICSSAWEPADLDDLKPLWTPEQKRDWLIQNASHIEDAMVSAGWVAIEALLDWEGS